MQKRHWIRIAGSFLGFVLAGTVGLVLLLNAAFQRLSHTEFVALAKANADFIRDTQLAHTELLARYLSQLLGVEVRFQRWAAPDALHEAVTVPIDSATELTLIRQRPRLREVLIKPISLCALAAFWALWFALAWAVALPWLKAQRFALLGALATSLAHEIRNPVAAIRLHGQLLEPTQPASAGLIVHEAAKIEDMVNQWMFLARPEPPRKTAVDLAALLKKTVLLLEPAAEHAGVRIELTPSPPRQIQADAQRLGQVFHNIILNAIQAMPEGGTLSITVSETDIRFADTGPGFSPAALRRGVEMLYSEKEGGIGLGLNVASNIIRAHGGRLILANRPGGGAVVCILL
jgi:signal transduction histidine kinase